MKKRFVTPTLMACLISLFTGLTGQVDLPAFPGAEGFGAFATGGRGGDVYIITNLNDDGPGSFREAVDASGPRTVVFAVSGTIELQSRIRITNGDLTIAGQTAPGDGIAFKNFNFSIGADNVIMRYITVRLGVDKRWENDAFNGGSDNVIVDHCTFSWGVDETASPYYFSNFTMQWCIISESLYNSFHSGGAHGMGGIWGGHSASFHHNLLAHHHNRLPRFSGSRYTGEPELEIVDHRNNVIYNWGTSSAYGAEGGYYNIVNNYYKSGPATNSSVRKRIIAPRESDMDPGVWGNFYVSGNYVEGYPTVTNDNWLGVEEVTKEQVEMIKSDTPFDVENITVQTAEEAYVDVLNHAGASLPKRDPVDARVTEETRSRTAKYGNSWPGIIDHPDDVGGYPLLESTTPPPDTDSDGMPDEWEDANGLDKNDPEDGKIIRTDGYSNLEYYLNSLVEDFKFILRPAGLKVASMDFENKIIQLEWIDISDDEEYFILERAFEEGNYVQVDTLDAGTQTYTDEEPQEYGKYSYRIKSVNQEMESCFAEVMANLKDPVPKEYTLSINIEGEGEVYLNPTGDIFEEGTNVGIVAEADEGWEFDQWSGDLSGSSNTASIVIDGDKTITAGFTQINVGLDHELIKKNVTIYPVPAKNEAYLNIALDKESEVEIEIFNIDGRLIKKIQKVFYPRGEQIININISDFQPGVYLLKIQTDRFITEKVLITK